jgi:hypothetical protein
MDALWALIKGRALYVSFAHDVFNFEISWLGLALALGAFLLLRRLRR